MYYYQPLYTREVHQLGLRNQEPYNKPTRLCSFISVNRGISSLRSISFLSLRRRTTSRLSVATLTLTIHRHQYPLQLHFHASSLSLCNTNGLLTNIDIPMLPSRIPFRCSQSLTQASLNNDKNNNNNTCSHLWNSPMWQHFAVLPKMRCCSLESGRVMC